MIFYPWACHYLLIYMSSLPLDCELLEGSYFIMNYQDLAKYLICVNYLEFDTFMFMCGSSLAPRHISLPPKSPTLKVPQELTGQASLHIRR